mmetsp:Transcript_36089/g.57923  ORF Transcript_36089/g.57923 Transcript_36089/m.57923 type:complete len:474 (+) Transcript_36089:153-1574(+)
MSATSLILMSLVSLVSCGALSKTSPLANVRPLRSRNFFGKRSLNTKPRVVYSPPPTTTQREVRDEVDTRKETPQRYIGDEAWLNNFDVEAFRKDIRSLGKKLEEQQGPEDMQHLNKIIGWSNACGIAGLATMGLAPNPFSILMLSLWTYSRWTMIAHHTCHGGYTKLDDSGRFNRGKFAIGSLQRRVFDWFDWMLPEAWNLEHNNLHHYNLGEKTDPDLVERNLEHIRQNNWPKAFKYLYVFGAVLGWKWTYYAPNTYKELKLHELRKQGKEIPEDLANKPFMLSTALKDPYPSFVSGKEVIQNVIGPYFLIRFLLLPAPLAIFGAPIYLHGVINLFLADLLSNVHAFITIVPNHTGKDMYKFSSSTPPNSGEFYLRQILSSANFNLGNDRVDFLHGWLNYQVEHHLWPNLSMLSYQKSQKEVEEICKKHNVPYIKENVFERTRKTIDIMVGNTNMRPFPESWSKANSKVNNS